MDFVDKDFLLLFNIPVVEAIIWTLLIIAIAYLTIMHGNMACSCTLTF
jgi:hypothetical protein